MGKLKALLLAGAILLGMANALAQPQIFVRVRGAVTGFDGHELQVKTRAGKALKIGVGEGTGISVLSEIEMRDIRQGSFVGVTAIRREAGKPLVALEVHLFPEAQRGAGEGHREWDLEPGSTMTNANIEAIVDTNDGKELMLVYQGGSQKIVVPPGTPLVTFRPADKSLLKAGAQVFISASQASDGSLTAQRIQVGEGGMKPPM